MSLYNSNITTRLIDPVFTQANFRTEFRLHPDTVYLTNMRLLNVGVTSSSASVYHGSLGVEACLKNITAGADVRPSMDSYKMDNINQDTGNETDPNEDSTHRGRVSLRDMLPFLNASMALPTSIFTKLRIVIEWNSDADLRQLNLDRDFSYTTLQPLLVVDELTGGNRREQLLQNYEGVNWNCVEGDRVILNEITGLSATITSKEQKERFNVNGFTNKTVNRMWLVQTPTNKNSYVDPDNGTQNQLWSGSAGSIAQFKPNYQFRVNGGNKLTRNGWSGANKRLGHLTDTFGDFNVPATQNQTWLDESDNISTPNGLIGQIDYTGLIIGERISEFQLDIDRTGIWNNPNLNQMLQLNLFGEVQKSLVMGKNNSYNVIYS